MSLKISVIIPIYNAEKKLQRCIDSILKQTYKNLEIILVNDGSTDATKEVCSKYEQKYPEVKLCNKENGGVSSARNLGIENSTGDVIFFIDCDDYINSEVLEILANNYDHQEKKMSFISFNTQKIEKNQYTCEEYIEGIMNGKILGTACGTLFSRKKIGNLRFDEKTFFMEDTLFLVEYLQSISEVKIISDSNNFYNYTVEVDSITNSSGKVFKNIDNFCYSLDRIDDITEHKYSNEITQKKVMLIEKESRRLQKTEDFEKLLKDEKIKNIIKENSSLFAKIYRTNNKYLLKIYYSIRKVIKKFYLLIKE